MNIINNFGKNRGYVCLFLAVCLWTAQVQVDDSRFLVPSESVCDGTSIVSACSWIRIPDVLLHRIIRFYEKTEEDLRSGSFLRQSTRYVFEAAAAVFLLSVLQHMRVYMLYNRHLHFSGTLIRYIQNQNGL